ncbi:MAG: prolyl oligopeptidase family serine peptidase, partial [Actinomycetales bacterium]
MWSGRDGTARVLIDPTQVTGTGPVSIAEWAPSPDGRLVAWAASESGSDWRTIRVVSVADGVQLPDVVPFARFTDIWWSADGKGFAYNGYRPVDFDAPAVDAQVRYHVLGTPTEQDAVLMSNPDEPRTWYWVCCSESSTKVLIALGPASVTFFSVPTLGPGQMPVRLFTLPGNPRPQAFHVEDGYLWIRMYEGAPRGRVVRVPLDAPEPSNWQTVVAEQPQALTGATIAGGRLILTYLKDASSRIRVTDLAGTSARWVDLPGLGTTGPVQGSLSGELATFTYSSFAQPSEVLQLNVRTGDVRPWRTPTLSFDPTQFVTTEAMIPSKDGTLVHAFIVRRRDVVRNGANPTVLWGYGGFNIPMTPEFRTEWLAWLQGGGVFVYANLRGGGEYGTTWYLDGTGVRKQNVFDDFIAVAEWLKQRRWTRSDRLAITGRSNGGLLVGAVMTQRPDLAAVAIPQVGVLDMLRYHLFPIGASWARDYGRSDDSAEMFAALLAYSPVHNVRSGLRYPATMITTAESDDRVVPAHSYKFAAALQQANAGTGPILIRIERGAGHGAGASRAQSISQYADFLAFLDANLGIAPVVPRPVFQRSRQ